MSLYSELASKFPTQVIEPFREPVLIVGVKEFKPQWEEQLKAEGCKILVSDFMGRSCFLIRKPNNGASQSENNPQNEPCETGKSENQHRKPWSFEETERLKQLFNEGKTYSELAEIFHRNKKAIQQKLYDMNLKRESVKPNPTPKPNPSHSKNNEVEAKVLIEASLQLLPSYPQAAKILLREAINQLDMVSG
jgi:hypothetical protein